MLKYLFFMVWVAYMLSIGIHIFSLGFLLKRDTLPDVGKCQPIAQCSKTVGKHSTTGNCLDGDFVHNMLENHTDVTLADFCLPTKSRVIMLVVDALRYDFGVFDSNLKHPLAYQNRLPVLDELQTEHPNRVRLVRFVADPPTTTLQRIKGLTTGSLPTFIDIGSNFDTGAIHEDSIIDRVVQSGRSAVFMGDSTWSDLFPGRFKRSHSMPSFNIYDLDTVDRAVSGLLQDELRLNDWDLLIAHTLGVDHCGHKYGPLHPEMTRKLTEVDELIRYIVDAMPADSTLLVVGDHGMTRTGDHGGESPDETNALLFAYSASRPFHSDYAGTESMLQIDLVPTLAAILGVPIPFSSLGQINYNLLPQMAEDAAIATLSRTHEFLMHTMQNVQQLRRYQIAITTRSAELFTESKIAAHAADWTHLQDVLNSAAGARRGRDSDAALRRFHADYARPFVHRVQHEFHTVWINFDPRKMTQGLLFVSLFSVLLFLLINNVPVQHFARTFSGSRAIAVGIVNAVASTLGANMYGEFGLSSPMDGWMVLGGIVNLGLIGLAVQLDFSRIVHTLRVRQVREAVSDVVWLVRIVFTFTLAVCFSNSFVVQEHYVLSYALMAIVGVLMYGVQRTHMQFDQRRRLTVGLLWRSHYVRLLAVAVVTVVLLRCSHAMFRCREEHGPLCVDGRSEVQQQTANDATVAADTAETLGQQKSKKGAAHLVDIVPVLVLAVFVGFARKIVERFGTLHGFRPAVCVARYGTVVLGVVVCVHFVLTTALTAGWTSVKATHLDQLAWVAYGVIAVQTLVLIGCPLLVFVHQNVETRNSMQAIFRQVRDEWANGSGSGGVDAAAADMNANGRSSATADSADNLFLQIPWTEGLTGAYTSVFLLCALSGGVVVALVLGTQAASGVVLALTVAGAVLVLAATQRFQSSQTIGKIIGYILKCMALIVSITFRTNRKVSATRLCRAALLDIAHPLQFLRFVASADAGAD